MNQNKSQEIEEKQLAVVEVPSDEKATVEIVPFGTDERIKLSIAIVRKMIAEPTRTGKLPDDNQCIKFMMLCKARHLNPFEGDAWMLGYDTQSGPKFSLITAHQVFLKRAEASKGFNGIDSGVIIKGRDEEITEREGDITFEGEQLLGGWAKVYRKDREHPFYKRLRLSTFNTNQSRWAKDAAGMIVKCAEADALRTAFPTHLGGLYVQEEIPPIDVTPAISRPIIPLADSELSGAVKAEQHSPAESGLDPALETGALAAQKSTKLKRKRKTVAEEAATIPNEIKMRSRLAEEKFTPADLIKIAQANGWIESDIDTLAKIGEQQLGVMLLDDNWQVVLDELKVLRLGKPKTEEPPF